MKENYFELCVIKDHQFGQHNCRVQYKMNYSSWFLSSGQQVGKRSISRFTSSGTAFRFYPCVADTERFCEGSIQLSVFPGAESTNKVFGRSKSEFPSFVLCNIMKVLWMKMNSLEHVGVKNCRINRKLVSGHPNSQLKLTIICQRKGGMKCLKIGGMLSISRHFTCTHA